MQYKYFLGSIYFMNVPSAYMYMIIGNTSRLIIASFTYKGIHCRIWSLSTLK